MVAFFGAFADVGVDAVHGGTVGPAADFHGYLRRDVQNVAEGGEAVAQAVAAYFGDTGFPAGFVDAAAHGAWVLGDYSALLGFYSGESFVEGIDDGNVPAAGAVFVGLFSDQFIVPVPDDGTADVDPAVIQVDVAPVPVQGGDLGPAERGNSQQGGDLHVLSFDVVQEGVQLVHVQEFGILADYLGEVGVDPFAGGPLQDLSQEAPAVHDGLGGIAAAFCVDGPGDDLVGDLAALHGHKGLETVVLDGEVAPDGGGGEPVLVVGDPEVNGLAEGLVPQGLLLDLNDALLDGHGLGDGGFFRGLGDGNTAAIDAELNGPAAGGELPGGGDIDLVFLFRHFYLAFPGQIWYHKSAECPCCKRLVVFCIDHRCWRICDQTPWCWRTGVFFIFVGTLNRIEFGRHLPYHH